MKLSVVCRHTNFAASLPGMTQDDPRNKLRRLAFAVHQHPRAQPKIHLRLRLPAPLPSAQNGIRLGLAQLPHEPLHRVIAAVKLMPPTKSW